MARIQLITRWAWSPIEVHTLSDGTEKKFWTIQSYASQPFFVPRINETGPSLGRAEFIPDRFEAALQDHRIIILPSLHSREAVQRSVQQHAAKHGRTALHDAALAHMTAHGVDAGATMHDLLVIYHEKHGNETTFVPEI